MMMSGGNSVRFSRPVTFRNTHSVIRTSALNSWLALPNSGQILAYPTFVRMNPQASVMMVEKYLLQRTLRHPAACSISSTLKSSWKDIRPIRATESRLVSASADTHMVIKHCAANAWIPNIFRNPATPAEKIWNGVPTAAVPSAEAAAPATQRATTANRLSSTMAP